MNQQTPHCRMHLFSLCNFSWQDTVPGTLTICKTSFWIVAVLHPRYERMQRYLFRRKAQSIVSEYRRRAEKIQRNSRRRFGSAIVDCYRSLNVEGRKEETRMKYRDGTYIPSTTLHKRRRSPRFHNSRPPDMGAARAGPRWLGCWRVTPRRQEAEGRNGHYPRSTVLQPTY